MNYLSNTIRSIAFLLAVFLAAQNQPAFGQQRIVPAAPVASTASPSVQSDPGKRQEAFQIVWQTVNDLFYDPKFGGVDWAQVRDRYQPQIATVSSDHQFHLLLQQMLNELNK